MSGAGATIARRPRSAGRAVRRALAVAGRMRRRLLVALALAAVLAAGYLLWLRDSSLVAVESVTVTGLTSDDSARLRSSLETAARQTTTLHVDRGRLEQAAAPFPVVRAIEVRADFPNGMRIHVLEHRPAALVAYGGKRVPVAADGSVLTGLPVARELPLVRVYGGTERGRVTGARRLAAVRVAAGLPAALAARVGEVRVEPAGGVVVPIEGGPRLVFGTAARAGAKWAAAVRVLADREAAGADYIDVRIPERPVAGGLPVATVAPAVPAAEGGVDAPPAAADAATASPARSPTAPQVPSAAAAPTAPGEARQEPAPPRAVPQVQGGEAGGAPVTPQP